MTLEQGALALIDAGYRIIPVHIGTKVPAVMGWASAVYPGIEVDELHRWFRSGDYGVGILTGLTSTHEGHIRNLLVIDVDSWAAWKEVCALHGWDDERPPGSYGSVKTPSGGRHFYFDFEPSLRVTNANDFPEGIDTRGDGGFVVAPPTKGYEWI